MNQFDENGRLILLFSDRPLSCIFVKRMTGSLFLLILMWWAFISFCNSRCPWTRSQGGLSSNNRIAPSELKEHSDSPPDYDTVLGICSKPIIDPRQPKPYPKLTRSPRKFSWEPNDSGWISLMIPRYEKQMWIPAQFNQNYPIFSKIVLGLGLGWWVRWNHERFSFLGLVD